MRKRALLCAGKFPVPTGPAPKLSGDGPRVAKRIAGRNRPASRRFLGIIGPTVKSAIRPLRQGSRRPRQAANVRKTGRFMQPAVVVTGASSGLGAEFARLAASEGVKVVLIARSRTGLDLLAADINGASRLAEVLALDLSAPDAGDVIARELDALDLYCHILVNNAGFGLFGDAVELGRERQFER